MRALIFSPWVRASRRYSGGKMWQWRSTPSNGFLEGRPDPFERRIAVADLVGWLAVGALRVPVRLERERAAVAVPLEKVEVLDPADLALADRVPGGQAGGHVDDVAVLDVHQADAAAHGLVALGV